MPQPLNIEARPRRRWRRWRRRVWKVLIAFIVFSALLVAVARLLSPQADSLRPWVEDMLTQRLGQPVRIQRMTANWQRLSPEFELERLQIGPDEEPVLVLNRGRVRVRLYNLVVPGRNVLEFSVDGPLVRLTQNSDGGWGWQWERGGDTSTGDPGRLLTVGDVAIDDSTVVIEPLDLPGIRMHIGKARMVRSGADTALLMEGQVLAPDSLPGRIQIRMLVHQQAQRITGLRAYAFATLAGARVSADDSRASMRAWVEWDSGSGGRLHLQARLGEGVSGQRPDPSMRLYMDGRWSDDEFIVELNSTPPQSRDDDPGLQGLTAQWSANRFSVRALQVDLAWLHRVLGYWKPTSSDWWPDRVQGTLSALDLGVHQRDGLEHLSGTLSGLTVAFPDRGAVTVEAARLGRSGDRPWIETRGSARIEWPALFEVPLALNRLEGRMIWLPNALQLDAVSAQSAEWSLTLDGDLLSYAGAPFVDLTAKIEKLSSTEPARWLPKRGIGPNTRRWLSTALRRIDDADAVTVLFGRPQEWHGRPPAGAVESSVRFRGLDLEYLRNWPVARRLDGWLHLTGRSLTAAVAQGQIAGFGLTAPQIRIADWREARLELEIEARDTDAAGLTRMLARIPGRAVRRALDVMEWSGPVSASTKVIVPLKHARDWTLDGQAELAGARLRLPAADLELDEMLGQASFTRKGFQSSAISAVLAGEAIRALVSGSFAPEFELQAELHAAVDQLLPTGLRERLAPVSELISGAADIGLRLGRSDARDAGLVLTMDSDLKGTQFDLPQPLVKTAESTWPTRLEWPLGDAAGPVEFVIGDLLSGVAVRAGDGWHLGLAAADGVPVAPDAERLRIQGEVNALALDGWIGLVASLSATERAAGDAHEAPEAGVYIDLQTTGLQLFDRDLGPSQLVLTGEPDYWHFRVDGERLVGDARLSRGSGRRALVLDFDRIDWPGVEPVAEGSDGSDDEPSGLDPVAFPSVDALIRNTSWGELELGELRLVSHKTTTGLEIEHFSVQSDALRLSGTGRWLRSDDSGAFPTTYMNVSLNTENLGAQLRAVGFDLAMLGGKGAVVLAGKWPGSPFDFGLSRISGTLSVDLYNATIPEARPGAGRLLGLVSLNSIPRRLRLDFSDVFGDGLSCDRIVGDFLLTGGMAVTENLRIEAPAAVIQITGTTDLRSRQYDQVLAIRPGLGVALPIIGAVAGGPVGAAAGAALQQVLSGSIEGASEIRYTVTGSWDEPRIEPMGSQADQKP